MSSGGSCSSATFRPRSAGVPARIWMVPGKAPGEGALFQVPLPVRSVVIGDAVLCTVVRSVAARKPASDGRTTTLAVNVPLGGTVAGKAADGVTEKSPMCEPVRLIPVIVCATLPALVNVNV